MAPGSASAGSGSVAIVGNMNNNGFALLRYLRDLGADAWLLPFDTDGVGNLAHFSPENDTWQFDRWRRWIRPLDVANTSRALLGTDGTLWRPDRRRALNRQLAGYGHFIGSGVAPALFQTLGRRLDVFAPYGMGIELYADIEFMHRRQASLPRYLSRSIIRHYQALGIRETRHCLNAEMSLTKDSFDAIGKPFERLAYPMLYNREAVPAQPPAHLAEAITRLRGAELSMFCCARLLWVPDQTIGAAAWNSLTKNSDWMLRGLAQFLRRQPSAQVVLAVVQYGPNVEASQRLARELGLDAHVLWLPKMARRDIMLLLDAAHIGIGEFYRDPGVIWGGTGWETLAAGRPLMQSFNFTVAGFEAEFGHPPPPILDVTSADDVARHIEQMHADPAARQRIGQASLAWFNRNNGIGMAERWLQRATGQGAA